jgi:hypothetical protein
MLLLPCTVLFQMALIYLVHIVVCLSLQTNGEFVTQRIPDILQSVCPGASSCNGNQTFSVQNMTLSPELLSCCNGNYVYYL